MNRDSMNVTQNCSRSFFCENMLRWASWAGHKIKWSKKIRNKNIINGYKTMQQWSYSSYVCDEDDESTPLLWRKQNTKWNWNIRFNSNSLVHKFSQLSRCHPLYSLVEICPRASSCPTWSSPAARGPSPCRAGSTTTSFRRAPSGFSADQRDTVSSTPSSR